MHPKSKQVEFYMGSDTENVINTLFNKLLNTLFKTNPVISKRRKWTSQENKIVMECYLSSEPKIRGYRKRMLSLWL